jgi:hypothetical protein
MATNLLSLVMQFLTPDTIARIASTLGLDGAVAQKAIGASVPALLAGFVGLASKPDGARQLSNTLAQQPPGGLDDVRNAIGGSGQKALVDNGSGILSTLLGGGVMNGLVGGVGKFAGVGEGASKSLLGLLGTVVLGTLGQQQRSGGLDANGLAGLLASQKDSIAAAMPSGFANLLGGTGLLDAIGGGIRGSTAAASAAAGRIGGAAEQAADTTRSAVSAATKGTTSPSKWLYGLVAIVVLAGLAWYFSGHRTPEQTAGTQTVPSTQSLTVGGVDLGTQVTSTVDLLKTSLQGITDTASAQAALPKLQDAAAQLDKVSGLAPQLSAGAKTAFAALVTAAIPTLNDMFDKVLAKPGVATVAKPAIDGLRAKLDALAKA